MDNFSSESVGTSESFDALGQGHCRLTVVEEVWEALGELVMPLVAAEEWRMLLRSRGVDDTAWGWGGIANTPPVGGYFQMEVPPTLPVP